MKKKHRIRLKRAVREFCSTFVKELRYLIDTFQQFGIDISSSMPSVFIKEKISFICVYTENRKHILIEFISNNSDDFIFSITRDDVFDYFDNEKQWKGMPVGIRITNSVGISIKSCSFVNCKPLEVVGDRVEVFIDDLVIDIPNKNKKHFEYTIIMSSSVFIDKAKLVNEIVRDIVRGYVDYYRLYGQKLESGKEETREYKQKFEVAKLRMEELFFDENIEEFEIDKFLEENHFVLEYCLGLSQLLHQVILKDLLDKYGQNLKPDLLAYNDNERRWTIIDYKRAKRSILKNCGKVRTSFKAEVSDLQSQLKDYREYFSEYELRKFFLETYGYDIEFPSTVGIIGRIDRKEERDFNRLREDLPRWFEIIPYNYLYNRYCRFLDTIMGIN